MEKKKILFHKVGGFDDLLRKKRQLKRQIAYKEEEIIDQVMQPIEFVTSAINTIKNAGRFIPMGVSIGKFIGRLFRKK